MLPEHLVNRILSCAQPYLSIRTTCTRQCDRLNSILSEAFPALDRPKQLRRAVVYGDLAKVGTLLKLRINPNAFVNETIEDVCILDRFETSDQSPRRCGWKTKTMLMEGVPFVSSEELNKLGAQGFVVQCGLKDNLAIHLDLLPSTPLVAASVLRKVEMVGQLLQAGAHFDPVVWQCERVMQNRRRTKEGCRRLKEDQRRAAEDRQRAKEDFMRAKEDSKRARQDARLNQPPLEEEEESEEESPQEEPEEQAENEEDETDEMLEREELQQAAILSMEVERKREHADIAEAVAETLMRSKAEMLFPSCLLKSLDVVQFRFTRCARCPEVSNALRTSEKLATQRARIEGSGCDLQPEYAGGMWSLVPLTHDDFLLANLQPDDSMILMYPSDEEAVRQALKDIYPKDRRPKLKKDISLQDQQETGHTESEGSEFRDIVIERTFLPVRVRSDLEDSYLAPSV